MSRRHQSSRALCDPCDQIRDSLDDYYKHVAYLSVDQAVPVPTVLTVPAKRGRVTLWFARDFSHIVYEVRLTEYGDVTQVNLYNEVAGNNATSVLATLLGNGVAGTPAGPIAAGFNGKICGTIRNTDLLGGAGIVNVAQVYSELLVNEIYVGVKTVTTSAVSGNDEIRGQFFNHHQ